MLGGLALVQEIPEYFPQSATTERVVLSSVMHLVECIDSKAPADITIIVYGGVVSLNSQAKKVVQLL